MEQVKLRKSQPRIWLLVGVILAMCLIVVSAHIANNRTLRAATIAQWDEAAASYAKVLAANITGSYQATQTLWPNDPTFRSGRFRYWLQTYPAAIRFLRTGAAFTTDSDLRLIVPFRAIPAGRSLYEIMAHPDQYGVEEACGVRKCIGQMMVGDASGQCTINWLTGDVSRLAWVRVPAPDSEPWEAGQYYYAVVAYREADALADLEAASGTTTLVLAGQLAVVIASMLAVVWTASKERASEGA